MAVVTFEKNYEFNVNEQVPSIGEHEQNAWIFWRYKDRLVNWTSNPWTVAGSSDAVTAGMDAVDRWVDYTDLHWEQFAPHSWIVLNHPTSTAQILIECEQSASTRTDFITFKYSGDGLFTGGTINNPPTAADEIALLDYQQWYDTSGPRTMYHHMIHAEDGSMDHWFLTYNGVPFLYWAVVNAVDRVDGYTIPTLVYALTNNGVTAGRALYAQLTEQAYFAGKRSTAVDDAGNFRAGLTTQCMGVTGNEMGQIVTGKNTIAQQYALYPCGIMSITTGVEGRHGRIPDLWLVPTSLASGDTIEEDPLNPTYELAVFGDVAVPWNGTVPVLA